jgi:hypothetical protein
MTKLLGSAGSEVLKIFMSDLRAARSVDDILSCEIDEAFRSADGEIRYMLDGGHSITLLANHKNNPCDETGRIDWSRVHRVQVTEFA